MSEVKRLTALYQLKLPTITIEAALMRASAQATAARPPPVRPPKPPSPLQPQPRDSSEVSLAITPLASPAYTLPPCALPSPCSAPQEVAHQRSGGRHSDRDNVVDYSSFLSELMLLASSQIPAE